MLNLVRSFAAVLSAMALILAWLSFGNAKSKDLLVRPPLQSVFSVTSPAAYNRLGEIDAVLEYMVWPRERSNLQRERIKLLRDWVNLSPVDAQVWGRLLAAEHDAGVGLMEQHWSLFMLLELRDWDRKSHNVLVHYCVRLNASLPAVLSQRCTDLLSVVKWRKRLSWQANSMGLTEDELQRYLQAKGFSK